MSNDAPPTADTPLRRHYWRDTPLEAMTTREWEALCDGCGLCCLVKLEDADTGEVEYTDVACRLLDCGTCRCSDYPNRQAHVEDCISLTPETVRNTKWLPPSCAYRLVAEGRELHDWHHLVSGDPQAVHAAGVSGRGRMVSEAVCEDDYFDRIVSWPTRPPGEVWSVRKADGNRRRRPD